MYWSEIHYEEEGRYVVCSRKINESNVTEWTPANYNARTLVHEYGGGAFFVYDRHVYFSNYEDQRLYIQKSPDSTPEPLTPEGSDWRFANATISPKVHVYKERYRSLL